MRFLNILKILSLIGTITSLISALILAVLSGYLQSIYKSAIGGPNTAELLAKKQFWAKLAESDIFLYLFYIALGFLAVFSVVVIVSFILRHIKQNTK